jgi:hypothetical protein
MRLISRQISLRTFFFAVTVIALLLAWWASASERQRRAAYAIDELGGRLIYSKPPTLVPNFAIVALGQDYFCSIVAVTLYPTPEIIADDQLLTLKALPGLKSLAIWPGCKGLAVAPKDPPGGLSDSGVDFLLSHLPNLRSLSLLSAQISRESERKLIDRSSIKTLQYETHSAFGSRSGGRQ